jgi:hypothetical protein
MNTPTKPSVSRLSPFEQWMVQSNLKTIRLGHADPDGVVILLCARGYLRVAQAVLFAVSRAARVRTPSILGVREESTG